MLIVGAVVVIGVVSAVGLTIGLSNSLKDLTLEVENGKVDAILADKEVDNDTIVAVPVTYYDQVMDECVNMYDTNSKAAFYQRQFEWTTCGYHNKSLEKELTEPILSLEKLPVGKNGKALSNRGFSDGFSRWFHTVEGKSKVYGSTLNLNYSSDAVAFWYGSDKFYPLNNIVRPDEPVNKDGNNHLFTMNLALPVEVVADGKESFEITADDDTWVFIDDKIALDMGGVHDKMSARFEILKNGEVYTGVGNEGLAYSGIKLDKGAQTVIRIFHADRDSEDSVFAIRTSGMLLNIMSTNLAKKGEDGSFDKVVAVVSPDEASAGDPTVDDSAYAIPLGESTTSRLDKSRMVATSIITQAFSVVALAVVVMVGVYMIRRQKR